MTKLPFLRPAAVGLLIALWASCEQSSPTAKEASCPHCNHAAATAPTGQSAKQIPPWESYNVAFEGCVGGCGMRMNGPTEGVVAQPAAIPGQYTYCLVSGVAFEIKSTTVQRQVGDKTFYFCCESCAAYFQANQASIMAARGLST